MIKFLEETCFLIPDQIVLSISDLLTKDPWFHIKHAFGYFLHTGRLNVTFFIKVTNSENSYRCSKYDGKHVPDCV